MPSFKIMFSKNIEEAKHGGPHMQFQHLEGQVGELKIHGQPVLHNKTFSPKKKKKEERLKDL
jgi:hypothetical protein